MQNPLHLSKIQLKKKKKWGRKKLIEILDIEGGKARCLVANAVKIFHIFSGKKQQFLEPLKITLKDP